MQRPVNLWLVVPLCKGDGAQRVFKSPLPPPKPTGCGAKRVFESPLPPFAKGDDAKRQQKLKPYSNLMQA